MTGHLAIASSCDLSVARLSSALGIPVIEGEVSQRAGTVVLVRIDQFDQYRPLMGAGSLAIVDRAAEAVMVRLGETETWLLATPQGASDGPADPDDFDRDAEAFARIEAPEYTLDADRANRTASRIAQATGFAVVARKPAFRDVFARPYVLDWYDAAATDWHVSEIALRARNLWEFGVLPRDAKALDAAGEPLAAIAAALGVARSRAKWAIELPDDHSMAGYL
ncbi:MAG TPA: hypothetical protein VIG97_11555 [Luteimonas sp.]